MFKWKRLVIIIFVIFIIIVIQARNIDIDGPFRGLLGNIVNPVIYYTDKLFSGIGNIWASYINLVNIKKENDEYKKIIEELILKNTLLSERLNQTERLETLVRFYRTYEFKQVPSNVIGLGSGYSKNLIIDIGSNDGIQKNDPVIGFQGLVGKVVTVYPTTSEVELILNIASNVSVMNSRTRVAGIMRGDGNGKLYVDYYDRLDDVMVGDVFITSGLGMLYPKGVRVGKVSEVIKSKTGLFQRVFIVQSEDFYKLEHVFIIKDNKK